MERCLVVKMERVSKIQINDWDFLTHLELSPTGTLFSVNEIAKHLGPTQGGGPGVGGMGFWGVLLGILVFRFLSVSLLSHCNSDTHQVPDPERRQARRVRGAPGSRQPSSHPEHRGQHIAGLRENEMQAKLGVEGVPGSEATV